MEDDKFSFAWKVLMGYERGKKAQPGDPGYSNSPTDPGGETRWGISKVYNPAAYAAVKTEADAIAWYHERWVEYGLGDLTASVAAELFEQAINFGPTQAWTNAQLACCLLGVQVKVDGKLGPITRHALNGLSVRYEENLMGALNGYQFLAYVQRAARSANAAANVKGWCKRTIAKFDEHYPSEPARLNTSPKAKAGSSEA